MAWQDVANQMYGPQAGYVIQQLQSINPNADWSAALQKVADANTQAFGGGWQDPSRGAAPMLISEILDNQGPDYASQVAPWTAAGHQREAAIQKEQNPPDKGLFGGGLGTALAIGGLALGGAGALGLFGDALGAGAGAFTGMAGDAVSMGIEGAMGMGGATAGAWGGAAGAAAGTAAGGMTVGDFNIFDPATWGGSTSTFVGDPTLGGMGTTIPDTITAQLPGGEWSGFGSGTGMVDLGGTGALPGVDIGGEFSSSILNNLPSNVKSLVQSLLQSGNTAGAGSLLKSLGIDPTSILGSGLSLAAREAPGLMALSYANSQGNDLQSIIDQLKGNQGAVVKAATDPLQANIAAGYGDLVQSLGNRGVRGSSFGNTDIANYIARTGTALSNAGANAAEGSLALQGQLTQQAQAAKNNLYGKAFDILGRGLSPTGFGNTLSLTA